MLAVITILFTDGMQVPCISKVVVHAIYYLTLNVLKVQHYILLP